MKVILLNGSPRKNGCTARALAEVEKELAAGGVQTEIINTIDGRPIRGCTACGACRTTGKCVFDNDIVNEVIQKISEADGVVIGSPVYYSGPNGEFCAMLDRVFYAGAAGFRHKPGAAVVSARRAGTTSSLDRLLKYFTITEMPVVSSRYWPMVHGNSPAEVEQDIEGLQIMRTLGKNMAWLLGCIEAGAAKEILPPQPEADRTYTNFIR